MKYFVGIFLVLIFASCEKFTPVSENTTTLVVHIISPEKYELSLTKDDFYDFNYKDEIVETVKIDENGEFIIKFNLKEVGVFKLKQKRAVLLDRVYLFPGDELRIEIDNLNKDDIQYQFKGKSANVNKFVINLTKMYPKDDEFYNNLINPNVEEFTKWIDNQHKEMLEYFDDFFFKDTVHEFVRTNEMSKINFETAYLKNEWAILNYYYRQDRWNEQIIPQDYFNFLNDLKIEEPYLHIFLGRYLESLLWDWHIKEVKQGRQPTAQQRELVKFEFAKNKFSGPSMDIAIALCLNDLIVYGFDERMLDVLNKMMDEFKQNVQDDNYYKHIESLYKKRLTLIKGAPAPDFTLPNLFNAPISLKDFKGKSVYVFFWSLQYQPSVEQLKKLTDLQIKFTGSDKIAIISISTDEDGFEKWKKFLTEESFTGIQLYSEGLFANKIAVDYMINSIPSAFIVDKEGKIFMMNAPLPSSEKLQEILESF